jgi:hypothetical protein
MNNIHIMELLFQINNLYRSRGSYGAYNLVYDRVKQDGHDMKYSPEELKEMWEKAKKKYSADNKRLIPLLDEAKLKAEITKVFKSMLVAKYLMNKVEKEGCLIITDEHGNKLELPQPFK